MKKALAIFLLVIIVLTTVACTKSKTPPQADNDSENNSPSIEDTEEDPVANSNKEEILLYFVNKDYVITGNEDLEKLITEKRTIEYDDISLEESIVKELIKGPESNDLETLLPDGITLLGVEVDDETAFVNFSKEGLSGGSLQEGFTISQIVNSLTQLDSVNRVQFLVDGQKAESLMGHYEISEPFEQ